MDSETGPGHDPRSLVFSSRDIPHFLLVALPVVGFASVMVWFSLIQVPPTPAVEGSSANPIGLLTSNFVYNGSENIENIVTSSFFLLLALLYYPRILRLLAAYLLPFVAVATGGFAQLTAILTVYATPRICGDACSFYGMSGVSNAVIGFTVASFSICFGFMAFQRKGRRSTGRKSPPRAARLRYQLSLVAAFALYIALLLTFAGVIALSAPVHHTSGPGTTTPTVGASPLPPPLPPIFLQSPPAWVVHSASLTYGFLVSVTIFFLVNRRYHLVSGSS
jgi:hypothetical protein